MARAPWGKSSWPATPGGQAKVVDFGLAKDVTRSAVEESGLLSGSGSGSGSDANSDPSDDLELAPTVLASSAADSTALGSGGNPLATERGAVLGTAAYMSPEHARGQAVDRRCDVWTFGCLLFEMFTGRRPFQGENLMQTLTVVLQTEPPWEADD